MAECQALRKNLCKNENCSKKRCLAEQSFGAAPFFYSIQKILHFVKVHRQLSGWNGAKRNEIRIIGGSVMPAGLDTLSLARPTPYPSHEAALSISWIFPVLPDTVLSEVLYRLEIRFFACSGGDSRC